MSKKIEHWYDDGNSESVGLGILTVILCLCTGIGYFMFGKNLFANKQYNTAFMIIIFAVVVTAIVGIFFQPLGWISATASLLFVILPVIFQKLGGRRLKGHRYASFHRK